jgi:hydrogenase expression/formation protein HypD
VKYIDEFRDADAAGYLRGRIAEIGKRLRAAGRVVRIMEVCGSHTMAISRFGIRTLLPKSVEMLSGPGCPVCVTSTGYIDTAIELAERDVMIASFGDMIRVPGSHTTLAQVRSQGAHIEICTSPIGAMDLARAHPDREVVFLAIGFETTVAPVISLVKLAKDHRIQNLSLLTAFKRVPPALSALLADPEIVVNAFVCPAHVSAIIGVEAYRPFVERNGVPCVIAGFEPLDILYAILEILEQCERGEAKLINQYDRVVKPEGNRRAQTLIDQVLQPIDAHWRGIGRIPESGLGLRPEFADYDAVVRHKVCADEGHSNPSCQCGEVLKGKLRPEQCPIFGRGCTPEHPIGPCMVSSEGSCAATYLYSRLDNGK